jgi:hypothetical protein
MLIPMAAVAQDQKPMDSQSAPPVQIQQPAQRSLWIAKYTADMKAAGAVASTQMSSENALKYSSLFAVVVTFESNATKPDGMWKLEAKEVDFSGGSTATRALVGFGAGRSHITMEYTLTDPEGKVAWTQKITTKPSFWGSVGYSGAVQNQGEAMDEQAQKLISALSKYFASGKESAKK